MTFTASVEGCEEDFECQFFGWAQFMCEIIRGWNEELGKLYEKKYRFLWDRNTSFFIPIMFMASKSKELDGEMAKILDEYDKPYNEGIKLFLKPKNDNEYTPAECELILAVFERVDPDKFDNSDDHSNRWYRESYIMWIRMLKYAIENNKSIFYG